MVNRLLIVLTALLAVAAACGSDSIDGASTADSSAPADGIRLVSPAGGAGG